MSEQNGLSDTEAMLERIDAATKRIVAASTRLEQNTSANPSPPSAPSSSKITALVNQHEAMREEVAGALRELDKIITKLEI